MDTIFPSRFFDRLRKADETEKRLMAAILEDAVDVYRKSEAARTKRDRDLLREVEAWLRSDDTASPFAFLRICRELAIDPRWFRQVLSRWHGYQQTLRSDVPAIDRLAS